MTAVPTTVLQHKYTSQAGKEQGSISASVFTSEDGEPTGRWRAAPVYQPTEVTEAKADGQAYARYEGYIESKPGVYFGIVLQWRSKNGALTKTWKLDDDLVAYYYLDGRPLPCMRYAIYQPGGKNPLPLSGLWPDNDTRYPLRWEKRRANADSVELDDSLFASSNEACPVLPPLFSSDDLGSIRITIHHKTDEENSRYRKFDDTPMPYNSKVRIDTDLKHFKDKNVTESIGLKTPENVSEEQLEDIYSGREAPAKSLPFLEFRLYYKNRETLNRLGILKEVETLAPTASTSSAAKSHVNGQESHSRNSLTNGHAPASSGSSKHSRPSESGVRPSTNGHRPHTSRSNSPLPPPLSAEAAVPPTSNGVASTSESTLDGDARPAAKRVKPEPQSSPNRNNQELASSHLRNESRSTSAEENQYQTLQYDEPMQANDIPSPPPLPDIDSQQTSLTELINPPNIPTAIVERQPTPSTSTSNAPPKAENPSPRLPTLVQRTGIKLDSPMPSQSQNSFFGNASQTATQEAREIEAEAFLAEDELDIAEPENIQALISVGFRTKKKFLSRLPHCDQGTRDKIFADLSAQMEPLDWGVLKNYLIQQCGL